MTENIHEKQSRVIEEFMKALSESQDFYDIKYILLVISRGGEYEYINLFLRR